MIDGNATVRTVSLRIMRNAPRASAPMMPVSCRRGRAGATADTGAGEPAGTAEVPVVSAGVAEVGVAGGAASPSAIVVIGDTSSMGAEPDESCHPLTESVS